MTDTFRLNLPAIEAAQAQKHVTHNEALAILDAVVMLAVERRDLSAPPGAPAQGSRYIIAAGATDAWAGHDDEVALSLDGAWFFFTPQAGWRAWVADERAMVVWTGADWRDFFAAIAAIQNLPMLGINATADSSNRITAKSDAVLLSHDDVTPGSGNLRVALNKKTAANDVGLTFQTGYGARALFGLLGDDDLTLKVTPDGTTFHTGICIDKDSGNIAIGTGSDANNKLLVQGQAMLFTSSGRLGFTFNKGAPADDCALTFQTGFSARALIGLLGDDDFTFKVTPNGSNYYVGFLLKKDTGQFKIPLAPKFSAYTNYDNYVGANAWTKINFNSTESNDQNAFNSASGSFVAPFAGIYALGFCLRFRSNATVPTKVIVAFYKNGAELGRSRAVSGAPVNDVTTYQLSVAVPLAAGDAVDVRVYFTSYDGYIKTDQSHFWGYYIP